MSFIQSLIVLIVICVSFAVPISMKIYRDIKRDEYEFEKDKIMYKAVSDAIYWNNGKSWDSKYLIIK